jgi:methionyl aminopeptidase
MRELQDGDIVNIDVSVYYNGFHSDLNETFLVGRVNEDSRRLVRCAYDSLAAAISVVCPGNLYK